MKKNVCLKGQYKFRSPQKDNIGQKKTTSDHEDFSIHFTSLNPSILFQMSSWNLIRPVVFPKRLGASPFYPI